MADLHLSNFSCISYQHSHYKSRKLPVKPTLTSRPTSTRMPYRPNIIPKCTRGFLSSITNSLSFLTLRPGAAACSSESMSTGENLAEVGFKILHLCDFEEMVVCNMGGLAFCPSPTSTVVKPKRKLLGKFVSICNLHFSAILYLTAGVPHSQKVFVFTRSF